MRRCLEMFDAAAEQLKEYETLYPGEGVFLLFDEQFNGAAQSLDIDKKTLLLDSVSSLHRAVKSQSLDLWYDWVSHADGTLADVLAKARGCLTSAEEEQGFYDVAARKIFEKLALK